MKSLRKKQKSIAGEIVFEGKGLHSGIHTNVVLKPAGEDTGLVFVRSDLDGRPRVRASIENKVENKLRRTILRSGEAEVHTIEHLMAVLYSLEISNLIIEMDSVEMPGLDGSAARIAEKIVATGIVEQSAEQPCFRISEPVSHTEGDVSIVAIPSADENLTITYTLDYHSAELGSQFFSVKLDPETFTREIAPSRTFCLESEVEQLLSLGLGKGATYQNTLVIGRDGKVIENELRFHDEEVRHKVLDFIGDVSLCGYQLAGKIICTKSGHHSNNVFAEKLYHHIRQFAEPVFDVYEILGMLPHRYPFLLVDKIIELVPGKRAVGIKNVTVNEEYFMGHFPGQPVMPGVLQIEALAQTAGIMFLKSVEKAGKIAYLTSLDNVKFRKAVQPGDQIRLEVEAVKIRAKTCLVDARAYVGQQMTCMARLCFMLL